MSESKVAKFIKEFDNLYTESKETIFQPKIKIFYKTI